MIPQEVKQAAKIELYEGDCLHVMDELIDNGVKVDAIITDPPYGTTACKWDTIVPFDEMWTRLNKLVKPNGAIVLFGSEPFSSTLRVSNLKNYRYDWVWDKVLPSGFQVAKYRPMMRHENILVFSKGTPLYYPIKTLQAERTGKAYKSSESSPLSSNDGVVRTYKDKNPQSILRFYKRDKVSYHPTQKPVALLEYLIQTYTQEGELVLDFTMGSGSTGVACINTNRNFIGIEMDKEYFEIAKRRINDS